MKPNLNFDEELKLFIDQHLILKIGESEYILDDPLGFIKLISKSSYYISGIIWWEHVEREKQKDSLGGGGPIDPKDDRFMYSEVYYEIKHFSESDNELCREYLLETPKKYPGHKLLPSFFLEKKKQI